MNTFARAVGRAVGKSQLERLLAWCVDDEGCILDGSLGGSREHDLHIARRPRGHRQGANPIGTSYWFVPIDVERVTKLPEEHLARGQPVMQRDWHDERSGLDLRPFKGDLEITECRRP